MNHVSPPVHGIEITYFLNRLPLISLNFFVHGLIMSSDGET